MRVISLALTLGIWTALGCAPAGTGGARADQPRSGIPTASVAASASTPAAASGGSALAETEPALPLAPCEEAAELRARVPALMTEGRVTKLVQCVREADRICPPANPATRGPLLAALLSLRDDDEARRVAEGLLSDPKTSASDAQAARDAMAKLAQPKPTATALRIEAEKLRTAGDVAGARRALDAWVSALEREFETKRKLVLPMVPDMAAAGVAWSDDGKRVAVARDDDVCLLEAPSWAPRLCAIAGPRGGRHMHFGATGRWLAYSGMTDVHLLDVETGRELGPFVAVEVPAERAPVWFVFDDAGKRVAWPRWRPTAQGGGSIVLLDPATGRSREIKASAPLPRPPWDPPSSGDWPHLPVNVDFDPTGKLLVAEWSDKSVRVHDTASGAQLAAFAMAYRSEESHFGAYEQSPDGRWLAWVAPAPTPAGAKGDPKPLLEAGLYDLASRRLAGKLRCLDKMIWGVRFSPDSSMLVAAGDAFCAWRTSTRTLLAQRELPRAAVNVALSPDGAVNIVQMDELMGMALRTPDAIVLADRVEPLYWAGRDGQRASRGPVLWLGQRTDKRYDRILHAGSKEMLETVPLAAPFDQALALSNDWTKLLVSDDSGYRIVDAATGASRGPVRPPDGRHDAIGVRFALLGDGATVVQADDIRGAVTLWAADSGATLYESPSTPGPSINAIEVSADFTLGFGAGKPRLERRAGRYLLRGLQRPETKAEPAPPAPERRADGTFRLPAGASSLDVESADEDRTYSAFLSPDERTWALHDTTGEPTLLLFDAGTRQRTASCEGAVGFGSPVFAPCSRWVATAGGKVAFWSTSDGRRLLELIPTRANPDGVLAGIVARAPDGRFEIFGRRADEVLREACRVGQRVVPFSACEDGLEEPGLVAEVLGGPEAKPKP